MKKRSCIWMVVISAALLLAGSWMDQAMAGGVQLTLVRATLKNVDDSAGRWQHEGGAIHKGQATVGHYAITRRVTEGGTTAQNTAMETVTLFFSGTPPQNVTLQGAHHFNNGHFIGSVSAASIQYGWIRGSDAGIIPTAAVGTSTLTINWPGPNALTLP